MVQYSLEVSVCWVIFFILYLAFFRKETFFHINRFYLIGALMLGMVIPFLRWLGIQYSPGTVQLAESFQFLVTGPEYISSQISGNNPDEYTFSFMSFVIILYVSGILFFTTRFLLGLWNIWNLYIEGIKSKKQGYILVETEKIHLPFSFFNCVFLSKLLPLNKDLTQILLHEITHIKNRHSADVLFIEVLHIFFWWNPLIYLYKSAIRQIHEYLADAEVLQQTNQKIYGQILLRQSYSGLEIALAHQFFHSHLKKRIKMMYQKKSNRPALIKYSAGIFALFFLAVLFSSQQLITDKESHPTENLSQHFDRDTIPKKKTSISKNEELFKVVEKMPLFPGCEDKSLDQSSKLKCANNAFINFLISNLIYPTTAKEKGVEGFVVVQFVVEKDGSVSNAEIVRDIGSGCGDAALSVIHQMNAQNIRWEPGLQRGKAVRVQYTLPVSFKLPSDQKEIADIPLSPPPPEPPVTPRFEMPPAPPSPPVPAEEVNNNKEIFKLVEQMPVFPGCNNNEEKHEEKLNCSNKKLLEYIYTNLTYPEQARKANIEGMTVVSFVIEADGSVSNVKLIRDIGGNCGQASVAAVTKMIDDNLRWTPGFQRGKAVSVEYTLPIKYNISDEK